MADWKEMYLKMFRATEKAIRILEAAQRECEEMYMRDGDPERDGEDERNEEDEFDEEENERDGAETYEPDGRDSGDAYEPEKASGAETYEPDGHGIEP